ncbi:Dehydroquinate synthase-like protein [Myriangium duriaei CBS 260.36]|uniref:Dehydroquinate synthase-like protein n=1 Tax=Myriangium duriaei CBS 260.36 TaxID=1168546 RepID=A0A9P4J672_9PEZI|nr:Dehydroquinate synthase-like protein [Myriangium duriaei CBS 260.36]
MAPHAIDQFDIPERANKLAIFAGSYLSDIPHFLSQWGISRIVLVSSKALYDGTDHVQKLEHELGQTVVGKKIGVGAHSPYRDVVEIAHLLQERDADCLISVGSSSYSDACKIASKLANTLPRGFTEKDMEGLIDEAKGKGVTKEAKVKVILIPTSLSAAEWNGTGSCTNSSGKKQHFGLQDHKLGAADLVLCDPVLASSAPQELWLSSGVRCIDHCVETICNRYCTAEGEADALKGLAEMVQGLIEYKQGSGEDRAKFLHGISEAQKGSRQAIKALIVHKNSFGPSHAIGHQLGSVAGVMHGITSCIMLAPVLKYTAKSTNPAFVRTKEGQSRILNVFNETLQWDECDAAEALTKFVRRLELPTRLSEVGVTEDAQLDQIAEKTLTDVWGGGEAQIKDKDEVRAILDLAR